MYCWYSLVWSGCISHMSDAEGLTGMWHLLQKIHIRPRPKSQNDAASEVFRRLSQRHVIKQATTAR